jgi:hypothetical protein
MNEILRAAIEQWKWPLYNISFLSLAFYAIVD